MVWWGEDSGVGRGYFEITQNASSPLPRKLTPELFPGYRNVAGRQVIVPKSSKRWCGVLNIPQYFRGTQAFCSQRRNILVLTNVNPNTCTQRFPYIILADCLFIKGLTSFSASKVISQQGKWMKGPEPLVDRFLFTMQSITKQLRQRRA